MKYYEFFSKAYSLKSKHLSLSIIDVDATFNSQWSKHCFTLKRLSPHEPIQIIAEDYGIGEMIEDDLASAGNPQVVSEEFKKLVEELDPGAAQFFETGIVNCKTQKKYYVMHVTKAINCLDEKRSKYVDFPEPSIFGRDLAVGMVDTNKIGESDHIFRLGEDVLQHYVSEKFYKEWKKRKLKGAVFMLRS